MIFRYFIFVMAFLSLLSINLAQNADIEIKIDAYTYPDTTLMHYNIICGLDLYATDGVDLPLGEAELPPMLPDGEVRFMLPIDGYVESYKDIRGIDYSGYQIIPHRIQFQNHYVGSTGYILHWKLPENIRMNFKDGFGGQILNQNFTAGDCSLILPGELAFVILTVEYTYDTIMGVNPKSVVADYVAGQVDFEVNFSNSFPASWHVENSTEWIEFDDGNAGVGNGIFSVNYPENGTANDRKANLTLIAENGRLLFSSINVKLIQRKSQIIEVEYENASEAYEYELHQNFPNPFNPATVISYQVPAIGNVLLKIYDVLGKEVTTLVNESKSPGTYEVEFDGSSLPSGIYFCKMQASNFTNTIKLILMK